MKILPITLGVSLLALFSSSALAQRPGGHPDRERVRERILERLDQNHDGKLDESERAPVRERLRERREGRGEGHGPLRRRIRERIRNRPDGERPTPPVDRRARSDENKPGKPEKPPARTRDASRREKVEALREHRNNTEGHREHRERVEDNRKPHDPAALRARLEKLRERRAELRSRLDRRPGRD